MKLFLASANNTLPLMAGLLPKNGKGAKVVFIENASDDLAGDRWWLKADRDAFEKMGCELIPIDLRTVTKDSFSDQLDSADAIHFCGGSVLHLMSLLRKNGLNKIVIERVRRGSLIYSGTSAGSMVASVSLSLSAFDEEEADNAKHLTEFSGLGLVPFYIVPHVNNKEALKSNLKMVENLSEHLQPLIFLDDNKAVLVEDNKFEIVSV